MQVIEWSSSRIDEVRALGEARRQELASGGAPGRLLITADRDKPNHYVTIVEFASYEEAMRNSEAPQTQEFAARMAELCDGPPVFHNLDIVESVIQTGGTREGAST